MHAHDVLVPYQMVFSTWSAHLHAHLEIIRPPPTYLTQEEKNSRGQQLDTWEVAISTLVFVWVSIPHGKMLHACHVNPNK